MRNLFTVLFLVGFLSIFAGGAVARADSYDVRVSLQAKNPSRNWSEFISSVTRDVRFVLEDQYACHFESELSWKIQGQSALISGIAKCPQKYSLTWSEELPRELFDRAPKYSITVIHGRDQVHYVFKKEQFHFAVK